jgi:hypothetical protein
MLVDPPEEFLVCSNEQGHRQLPVASEVNRLAGKEKSRLSGRDPTSRLPISRIEPRSIDPVPGHTLVGTGTRSTPRSNDRLVPFR